MSGRSVQRFLSIDEDTLVPAVGLVGGTLVLTDASFSRPADTTPYTVKDVISNSTSATAPMEFENAVRTNGGKGYITCVRLVTNSATALIGVGYRLYLYTVSNPTVAGDNSPMTLLWANRTNRLGHIDLDASTTMGAGSDSASALNDTVRLRVVAADDDTSIYGVLVAMTGSSLAPASGQSFYVELTVDQY